MSNWTDQETAIALIGFAACMIDRDIARELQAAGYFRTTNGVKHLRGRLRLPSAMELRARRSKDELETIEDAQLTADIAITKDAARRGDEAFKAALSKAGYTPQFPEERYARSVPLRGSF